MPIPSFPNPEEAVSGIVTFFERMTPASVANVGRIYAPRARFKDPFNEVEGVDAIRQIFDHMFVALRDPRFVVTGRVVQGAQCFLTWDFVFCFRNFGQGRTQTIRGASHLVLDGQRLITLHRDYWDAAEELYEKLPVVGGAMRWLKNRVNSPS